MTSVILAAVAPFESSLVQIAILEKKKDLGDEGFEPPALSV